ncbi:hypothetical protein [Halobacterium jilantaiense]|uniref:Uncharacterized protein n=1 Tax=Halobacterium jilantaiense TaxID=355548 RepID=A0A1I0Q157_9EURY|nr:hypothetical protein [Halobacterium jilantaiense]SEW20517.1 hypothetical protein SAMN04487945_2162 [Halobacterium jilantaiense]
MSDEYLFALREGHPGIKFHRGVSFDYGRTGGDPIQFIDDEDTVNRLKNKTDKSGNHVFRWVATSELEAVLDAADDAAAAIEAGEHDAILDLLLAAEQKRYGPRVTVLDAIGERSRQIEAESNPDDLADSVTVADVRASIQ